MGKIRLIWIGKTQEAYLQTGIELYLKKLRPYLQIEILELKPMPYQSGNPAQWKAQETIKALKKLERGEISIFLDESGEKKSSVAFAQWFERQLQVGPSLNFVIGGPYGWDATQLAPPLQKLSLSTMTYNHQMVRIILLEQLYRAMTILRGEPYHH